MLRMYTYGHRTKLFSSLFKSWMRLKFIYFFIFLFITTNTVCGQREYIRCEEDTRDLLSMSCQESCIVCDLDGYSYRRSVEIGVGYRFLNQECNLWVGEDIAFVAATEYITFEVAITECTASADSQRIENWAYFQVMEPSGTICEPGGDFNSGIMKGFFSCDSSDGSLRGQRIDEGQHRQFRNDEPFIPGQIYYLRIANISSVSCLNTIRIIEGSTAVPQLTDIALTNTGPTCPSSEVTYRVVEPPAATNFTFTLNDDTLSTADSLTIAWSQSGTYELCISADNPCSEAVEACYDIVVEEPERRDTTVYLCPDDCYTLPSGNTVCESGIYESRVRDQSGCEINHTTRIEATPVDTTELLARVCSGDTLNYRGNLYFDSGIYEFGETNRRGCDSIVQLAVTVEACPLDAIITGQQPQCHDSADGTIEFAVNSGRPPFLYTYQRLGGGFTGRGSIAGRGQYTSIEGLPPGTYLVEIKDAFGSEGYLNLALLPPDSLTLVANLVTYEGDYNTSCATSADGRATLSIGGGVAPYRVAWSDTSPTTDLVRDDLAAGMYRVKAVDANGCETETVVEITAPNPLRVTVSSSDEKCNQPASGSLDSVLIEGGVRPYTQTLYDESETPIGDITMLDRGGYRVEAIDGNGCTTSARFDVRRPAPATIEVEAFPSRVQLGETVSLKLLSPQNSVAWIAPTSLDCDTCRTTDVLPTETFTAVARSISSDSCIARDSAEVVVFTDYSVYVPTAFSPNYDGRNDRLLPLVGPAAMRIVSFTVYNRWGGQVYHAENLPSTALGGLGWDGTVKGQPAGTGVYLWTAKIAFIDGQEVRTTGSVQLMK